MPADNFNNSTAPDARMHPEPLQIPGMNLPTPSVATPMSRLAAKDFGSNVTARPAFAGWLAGTVVGWGVFLGFLAAMGLVFLLLTRLCMWVGDLGPLRDLNWGLSQAIGNVLGLILVFVMVTGTLLTMADRKWSALMQNRVGPNRARLPIPGLSNLPLKGLPHILADVLKMLFKEDFIPEGAVANKFLFNLAPFLAFAPAFCLFAVVPMSPEVVLWGEKVQLQVAKVDWGILYVLGLASLAPLGTALAGWTSNNKLALLGGLRASAQLVSYEVTLGLTLVGAFIVFGSLRLEEMSALQGVSQEVLRTMADGRAQPVDGSLLWGWLPAWGAVFQPAGVILFLVAAMAEIKRAPFDTPEGESEIIGYFLEYSGLKSGMFLIAEYAETVVIAGIVVAIFLGGYHIPWLEPQLIHAFNGELGISGEAWLAVVQVFTFLVKVIAVIWVMFLVRWTFPRFRYDQIMRLGWKMMLPVSLVNVVITAGVFLWGGREGLAFMGLVEWVALAGFIAFSAGTRSNIDAGSHGTHATTSGAAAPAASH